MNMNRRHFLKATAAAALSTSGLLVSGRFGAGLFAQSTGSVRIPIHMSHGVDRIPRPTSTTGRQSLNAAQFDALYRIARDMGCETIGYDDLENWRNGTGTLPRRPLMIDFDHPTITMRYDMNDIMQRYGFRPTLFINTAESRPRQARRGRCRNPTSGSS
jgi:hypothetical protein